MSSEVERFVDC